MLRFASRTKPIIAILVIAMVAVALACGGEKATPTSPPTATTAPTPTPAPTATEVLEAVPTPTATAVPEPTAAVGELSGLELVNHPGYDPDWGTPVYGGELQVRTTWPQTQNSPFYASMYRGGHYATPQYNALLRMDVWLGFAEGGTIEPDLAESWEVSGDGLTYTFYLRRGVKFREPIPQDTEHGVDDMPGRGTEFTCEDAKATLDFIASGGALDEGLTGSDWYLSTITETRCPDGPDGYTLEVDFEYSGGWIIFAVAFPNAIMVDKDWLEWLLAEHPQEIDKKNFFLNMGTGAFLGTELEQDVVTRIRRNPNYWKEGQPFLDGVAVFPIKDAETTYAAWATGKIEVWGFGSGGITATHANRASSQYPDKPIYGFKYTGGQGISFNIGAAPLDNAKVRKALHMAVDRSAWIGLRTRGDFSRSVLSSLVWAAGDFWGHTEEEILQWPGYRQPKDQDIAEANQLLDEVFGPGERPTINCLTRSNQNYVDVCLFVQEEWRVNLDVKGDAEIVEGIVNTQRGRDCQFQVQSAWPTPLSWIYMPHFKYLRFDSTLPDQFGCYRVGVAEELQGQIDDLIHEFDRTLDVERQLQLSRQLDEMITSEAVYGVPLETMFLLNGGQPWVKGLRYLDFGTKAINQWVYERVWKVER